MHEAARQLLWLHYVAQHRDLLDPLARREMTELNHQMVIRAADAKVSRPA